FGLQSSREEGGTAEISALVSSRKSRPYRELLEDNDTSLYPRPPSTPVHLVFFLQSQNEIRFSAFWHTRLWYQHNRSPRLALGLSYEAYS
ncbi:hypothetical protein NPIL_241181, partial [Nephila pilipes]